MRTTRALVSALCLAALAAAAPAQGGSGSAASDDPRAAAILDAVLAQYGRIKSFSAHVRHTDIIVGEWRIGTESRAWDEVRKKPNLVFLCEVFPQETELAPEIRLLGEKAPAKKPPEDRPLRRLMIACDGKTSWAEFYTLFALQCPVGKGQEDTEAMATQPPAALRDVKSMDDWPSDVPKDISLTTAQLLDGTNVRSRIAKGSLKLVIAKDADGHDSDTQEVSLQTAEGPTTRVCKHIEFLLTNGVEQHWWVDTENSMVRAELVVRVIPPAKNPFDEREPKVKLPSDLTDLAMDRLQRARRYMTGRFVRSVIYYDNLAWDVTVEDSAFTYTSSKDVRVVQASELDTYLGKFWEWTQGRPLGSPPPGSGASGGSGGRSGGEPLLP